MGTNVKSYTDKQLLGRVRSLSDFTHIPNGYWNLWVASIEDEHDKMDDKRYLFNNETFISVSPCTTNKGKRGTAVIKTDQWLYDGFIYGLHKGKMPCFRQNKPFYFYRDFNEDTNTDEVGELYFENIQTQWHGSTYHKSKDIHVVRENIGAWSEGCLVDADNEKYERDLVICKPQGVMTGCIIKEF